MHKFFSKKMIAAAAALVLCVGVLASGNTALADSVEGFFRDIFRGTAVVGTEYADASAEVDIAVNDAVLVRDGNVHLDMTIDCINADSAPFKYIEEITLGDYTIMDQTGKTVVSVTGSDGSGISAVISDGAAAFNLPVSSTLFEKGSNYVLKINSLWGREKADAPLLISGSWECAFTVE